MEQLGHLPGVRRVAGGILLRLIEQPPHIAHLMGRHMKHPLEGVDLVAGHHPVGLGHLRGEHDDRDRERRLPLFLAWRAGAHLVHRMAGRRADDGPQGTAQGKPRRPADDLSPNAHADRPPSVGLAFLSMLGKDGLIVATIKARTIFGKASYRHRVPPGRAYE